MNHVEHPGESVGGLAELVGAAQAGDRDALAALLERAAPVAAALARAACSEVTEAEDALQDSLLEVCTSLPRLADHRAFWPWLRQVVLHNVADRRRRRAVRREVRLEEATCAPEAPGAPEKAEGLRELREALAQLEPEDQEMLGLRHEAGLSLAEIAAATGRSLRAVESRLFRARQLLRRRLARSLRP